MSRADADRIEIESDERQLHLTIGPDWGQVATLSVAVVVLAILPFIPIMPGGHQGGELVTGAPELILLPLLLGLLGAVFLGYLVWEALGREEILVDETNLTLVTRLFFLHWERVFSLATVSSIGVNERMQAGQGGPKVRRTIRITRGRRRRSTVKHLSRRDAARIVLMIEAWRAGTRDAGALALL